MQLSIIGGQAESQAGSRFSQDVVAQVTVLSEPTVPGNADRQLDAYQAVAGRWRTAVHGERAALASVLTDTPFGKKVHEVLNAFTRAAWPGDDRSPGAAQSQMLKAFDALPETDRKIVASLQTDPSTGAPYPSAEAYYTRLRQELDAAQAAALTRAPDTVTLSAEAQARLNGDKATEAPARVASEPAPRMAAAIAAYARVG